jgi:hypothetical protein
MQFGATCCARNLIFNLLPFSFSNRRRANLQNAIPAEADFQKKKHLNFFNEPLADITTILKVGEFTVYFIALSSL